MRLIFHGSLREQFGNSADMASTSVADALEGFSRQTAWPADMPVRITDGTSILDSEEKLAEKHDVVHIIPVMRGGSGKFFNIILGTVLVVAGILLLPNPIGISLIISGGVMILQGVISLFMKAPKLNTQADPDGSKYLAVNKNTTTIGTTITMAWGCIDLAGQWVSLQSDSNNLSFGVFPTTPT